MYAKTQLKAKFNNILYIKFIATLTFQNLKVALKPISIQFLNFAKSCLLSWLLRTFELIVSAHRYCARKYTSHVMYEATSNIL